MTCDSIRVRPGHRNILHPVVCFLSRIRIGSVAMLAHRVNLEFAATRQVHVGSRRVAAETRRLKKHFVVTETCIS